MFRGGMLARCSAEGCLAWEPTPQMTQMAHRHLRPVDAQTWRGGGGVCRYGRLLFLSFPV